MIYIEKGEKVALPKRYHEINNICAIIYDQLAEIYADDNYKILKVSEIKFEKHHKLISDLRTNKIHILEWLKKNDLNEELTNVLTKHLTLSVVSDFVNFIYESFSCAKRGKMTVAYALLRKPLTDELLILEQLLYDSHDFIQRFYHSGDPIDYDPSHQNVDKKKIIKNVFTQIKSPFIFTEDIIYELRFDKSIPNGINSLSNHALHIVTRDKNYRTENKNLNFVFSVEEDVHNYWEHYYYFIPYLLIYSVTVIDNILFKYMLDEDSQNLKAVKAFRRLIGTILFIELTNKKMAKKNKQMFKILSNHIKIRCEKCDRILSFAKEDFKLFFELEILLCPKCLENVLISPDSIKPIRYFMNEISD